jgi:hypothetical protein
MTEETCGKCNKTFNERLGMVAPIDETGKNLVRVFLCHECMVDWHKIYYSYGIHLSDNNFYVEWADLWKRFISGELVTKERVDFT